MNSFGFVENNDSSEGGNGVPENNIRTIYQSIGSEGVYAAMTANLIVTSKVNPDDGFSDKTEICNVQLNLDIGNRD